MIGFVDVHIDDSFVEVVDVASDKLKAEALQRCARSAPGAVASFDSDQQSHGLSRYTANKQTILSERVSLVRDPAGLDRIVMRFNVRPQDNRVLYARAQLSTPSFMRSGQAWWVGFGLYLPRPIVPNKGMVMLHEIYGPPFRNGPNSLRWHPSGRLTMSNTPMSGRQAWDDYEFWSLPNVSLGKWYDFAFRYAMSSKPSQGSVEVWLNDGSGWKQQKLGRKGHRDSLRLHYDTLRIGGNGGGANYSSIKVAQWENHPVEVYFSGHKVGKSLSAVDPGTYETVATGANRFQCDSTNSVSERIHE